MKNVLVTGASGFLGKNLVAALTQKECRVYALARHFDAELQNNCNVVCVDVNGKNVEEIRKVLPNEAFDCMVWKYQSGGGGDLPGQQAAADRVVCLPVL